MTNRFMDKNFGTEMEWFVGAGGCGEVEAAAEIVPVVLCVAVGVYRCIVLWITLIVVRFFGRVTLRKWFNTPNMNELFRMHDSSVVELEVKARNQAF